LHWSTHQLTEYFAAVSASADEDAAIQMAVERAVEALEAEVGAAACGTGVRGLFGLLPPAPPAVLAAIADNSPTVDLPGLGPAHAAYAGLGSGIDGKLVVARIEGAFATEERQMLQGMGQVLGLALRNLGNLAVERSLRQEREREAQQRLELLGEVQARQALLETLLAIQRAISHREPLPSVLDAVTAGASNLLGQAVVVLVLADAGDPGSLIMASTYQWSGDAGAATVVLEVAAESMATDEVLRRPWAGEDGRRLLAAPVHVSGTIGGSLVAILVGPTGADEGRVNLIAAFAQQISMALTDAHTVEAMHRAYRDPLTDLPNRKLFLERLDQALTGEQAGPVTILFIDLDRFKSVNDSLGHRAGDDLLVQVSGRLRRSIRGRDVAARLGGDEFAVLLEAASVEDGLRIAGRISADIAEPYQIAGRTAFIGSSVGVATCHTDRSSAAELLSNADVAMYRAKKTGSGEPVVYEPYMQDDVLRRLDLEADLRHALAGGQLRLVFQPLIRLDTGEFAAAEALLRWRHPTRGDVSPAAFIPIAEEIGLIDEIGRWVLREAAEQVGLWRTMAPALTMNVNVSARQLSSRRFVDDVTDVLSAAAIPGHALTLELTETALMTDPATALRHLQSIKEAGVHLAVDDFGTGYSSLSQLRRFPVDHVKIDHSFVAAIRESTEDRAVVRAIIDLGRALRLEVVAEGIENAAQLRELLQMGCHLGQGYYLHRPMEPPQFGESLRRSLAAGPNRPTPVSMSTDHTITAAGR
jgi:diguanylate cyclase (GGDEF)-like protein